MNNHIEERKIELMLLDHPDISNEEREEIFIHLEACRLCKENYLKLKNFYEEIESEVKLEPSSEDVDFAQKLLQNKSFFVTKLLEEPKKAVKIYDGWIEITEPYFRTKLQKFVRFVRQHPKGFTGSLVFAYLFLVLLFYTLNVKIKDSNPSYAWIENQVLYVQNAEGRVLWKMSMPGVRNTNSNLIAELDQSKIILVDDINGDLINEVLITGDDIKNFGIPSDSLFCYSSSGKLMWKTGGWEFPTVDAKKWLHTKWYIINFTVIRDNKKNKPRLFVLANDNLYSPSILLELDGKTGQRLQSFYNVGGTAVISKFDFDEDGQDELIIGGLNDPYRRAYLAVFDINKISGYSPSTKEYLPKDVTSGSFKYYIIFPFTKLGQMLGSTNYNSISNIKLTKNELISITEEVLGASRINNSGTILYTFDKNLRVKSVITGDGFNKNYERLREEGKLNEELNEAFLERLKSSVLYWDGDKFAETVSVNKYYKPVLEDSTYSMR